MLSVIILCKAKAFLQRKTWFHRILLKVAAEQIGNYRNPQSCTILASDSSFFLLSSGSGRSSSSSFIHCNTENCPHRFSLYKDLMPTCNFLCNYKNCQTSLEAILDFFRTWCELPSLRAIRTKEMRAFQIYWYVV